MKKTLLVLLALLCGIAIGVSAQKGISPSSAQTWVAVRTLASAYQATGKRSLNSIHRIAPPIIDGKFDDWLPVESIDVNRDTSYSFSGRIDNPADLSASVRSSWSNDTLYFAIHVNDDIIVTDSADVWRDDGVEIALDGLRDLQAWGADDHQYTVVADGRVTDRGVSVKDITAAVITYAGGYDIEVAIPMSKLIPGVPISGTMMGFTIGIHDDDDGGNWDAYLIWEGTNTSSLPEQYANLVFIERPEDRIAVLEAKVAELERKVQELLTILSEFEGVTPP